jgi:hypothetical protein
MGHALRVTEAGATPQKPWRTVRQRVGSLPPHPNLAASFPGFLCAGYLVSFCGVRSNRGLKRKILWPEVRG